MITWFFGQTGAGKTTEAKKIVDLTKHFTTGNPIILDGDEMRQTISSDLGYSLPQRRIQHERVAKLARLLNNQGFDVVVATIMPTKEIRKMVRDILEGCDTKYIYCPGGREVDATHPFETPAEEEYDEKLSCHNRIAEVG